MNEHFTDPNSNAEKDGVKFGWDVGTTSVEKRKQEKKWRKQTKEVKKQMNDSNN